LVPNSVLYVTHLPKVRKVLGKLGQDTKEVHLYFFKDWIPIQKFRIFNQILNHCKTSETHITRCTIRKLANHSKTMLNEKPLVVKCFHTLTNAVNIGPIGTLGNVKVVLVRVTRTERFSCHPFAPVSEMGRSLALGWHT
jgi:hypothetical protein